MNKYRGIKTRRQTKNKPEEYALERLGTMGWAGAILATFLLGAVCGMLRAKFGG